ncbi:hypothetical protein TWF506_006290 [Arthrobotrys conoides]|uniref:Uncharacterized protein n=1 Tax=Arthrobotrys conoides TaxID=74498 RepID=A0AAN8NRF8_9PEZI
MQTAKVDKCICGYHKRCLAADGVKFNDHDLGIWDIRDTGYDNRCNLIYGQVPEDEQNIDHIIELWQVKEAYFRALEFLTQFTSGRAWYDWDTLNNNRNSITVPDPNNVIRDSLYIGHNYKQTTVTLNSLNYIFNNPHNLCAIEKEFNSRKNKFLDKPMPIIPGGALDNSVVGDETLGVTYGQTRLQLQAYYLATAEHRAATMNELQARYHQTGDIALFLIRCYLEQNYHNFTVESNGAGQPIAGVELHPQKPGSKGPIEYFDTNNRARILNNTVDTILGSLSTEEQEAINEAWKHWK